jgi:hypothetical protein
MSIRIDACVAAQPVRYWRLPAFELNLYCWKQSRHVVFSGNADSVRPVFSKLKILSLPAHTQPNNAASFAYQNSWRFIWDSGGGARARTWDPPIRSLICRVSFQQLGCKLRRDRAYQINELRASVNRPTRMAQPPASIAAENCRMRRRNEAVSAQTPQLAHNSHSGSRRRQT